jgi:hypothetical protein
MVVVDAAIIGVGPIELALPKLGISGACAQSGGKAPIEVRNLVVLVLQTAAHTMSSFSKV